MSILALTWAGIIAFGVIMYVLLDGFDLGIGILSAFTHDEHHRDIMISSIMPVWDGNETWLVFNGAAMYGAFPLAFSTLLPTLYIPALTMVAALLFRGVAFEFRLKAERSKVVWEWSFFVGSLVATFMQGVMLGAFVQGFKVTPGHLVVHAYQWMTSFSFTTGIALVFGYSLLASNWLIGKSEGQMQKNFFNASKALLVLVALFELAISLWTPFIDPAISGRWFNPQLMPILAIFPVVTIGLFVWHWVALFKKKEYAPFWLSNAIFVMTYFGFIVSIYPYIVPRSITFTQAAAPDISLKFMLVGAIIMLPILLYYTYYSYKIFRGKVTEVIHY